MVITDSKTMEQDDYMAMGPQDDYMAMGPQDDYMAMGPQDDYMAMGQQDMPQVEYMPMTKLEPPAARHSPVPIKSPQKVNGPKAHFNLGSTSPPAVDHSTKPTRHGARRRTFRRRLMRRQSHASDLVILHTATDAVFDWARYIKSEVESRCPPGAAATLISSVGFVPRVQDNVRRTLSSAHVALVIVSPDLITSLEQLGSPTYSFDFVPVDGMAGAVIFFCGVEEGAIDFRKYFPHYDRWTKYKANTDEAQLTPIFEHLAKLIGESEDSSPETPLRRTLVRRGHSDAEVYRIRSQRGQNANSLTHQSTVGNANNTGLGGAFIGGVGTRAMKPLPEKPQQRRRATIREVVQIFPDKGRCDQSTDVAAILSDDLLPCQRLEVECEGEFTLSIQKLETTRLNTSTFQFTMPEGMAETARLRFVKDGQYVGSATFTYESPLEESEPVMQLLVSGMDGLCELLTEQMALSETCTTADIDQKLLHIFQRSDIPAKAYEQLFHHYMTSTRSERRNCALPTLLHLVAKYGLQELTAMLVDLPGAKQAFSLTDPHGQQPNDMARAHGHHELTSFLEDYMGMVANEEMIYSSMKEYISSIDGIAPLSEDQLGSTVPVRNSPVPRPGDDYCAMDGSAGGNDDIYLPMGSTVRPSTHPVAPPTPPDPVRHSHFRDIKLDTEVPGPGAHNIGIAMGELDYIAMAPNTTQPTKSTAHPRRPLPPTPSPRAEGHVQRLLKRSTGIDLGSKESLDYNSDREIPEPDTTTAPSDTNGPHRETPDTCDKPDGAEEEPALTTPPSAPTELISAPMPVQDPFSDLLAPNASAPKHKPSPSASQAELLDIIYQVKDGELSVQDAECLVDGWKKQYQIPRFDKKSFKEKKESIRVLKDSYLKTAERVKEEVQQSKQTGIKRFFKRKKTPASKGNKTPPPDMFISSPLPMDMMRKILSDYQNVQRPRGWSLGSKSHSAPEQPSVPMVDTSRLQTLQSSYEEQRDNMSCDPVCQSIPDLPPGVVCMDDAKRFSTISTSSSSSTTSCMSRTSYGSQQDSGIDVPIREESPSVVAAPGGIYDRVTGVPRPVLPMPASAKNSSDECSGYEDVDHWIDPEGGSIRARTDSSTLSEPTEESSPNAEKSPDEAPPIPPRSRRASNSSVTSDLATPTKLPSRSRAILPPKAGVRKSSLPQPQRTGAGTGRGYPPVAPKPNKTSSASETSSGGEGDHVERQRTSGIPAPLSVSSVLGTSPSGGGRLCQPPQRPMTGTGNRSNYSNVVLDLKTRQRKASTASTGTRSNRGSMSDEGSDAPPSDFAPPVPPRSPRD